MDKRLTIENADNFNSVLMTQNGFPIFDVMMPVRNKHGIVYCSASDLVFYTEDETVLQNFKSLDTEGKRSFLLDNMDYIQELPKVLQKVKLMPHPLPLAYNNLMNNFKKTIKEFYYGSVHLEVAGELLIFHSSSVRELMSTIDKNQDLENLYQEIQTVARKAYEEKTVEPEGIISKEAFSRLKSKNSDFFVKVQNSQDEILDILKAFKSELLDNSSLSYEKKKDLIVFLVVNEQKYKVKVSENSDDFLELSIANEKKYLKNINDVIDVIYSDVNFKKVCNFKSKMNI